MSASSLNFDELNQYLQPGKNIVFLTGAGLSAESGISTFRGEDGLWSQYDPQEVATPDAFRRNPEKVWAFYQMRRKRVANVSPSFSHTFLAQLDEVHSSVYVITQNVDHLHEEAGQQSVLHVHGQLMKDRCSSCGQLFAGVIQEDLAYCSDCEGLLRPDVVWFGESLDPDILSRSRQRLSNADLTCVMGTSLEVAPVSEFPRLAHEQGSRLLEVNPDPVLARTIEGEPFVFEGAANEFFKSWNETVELSVS